MSGELLRAAMLGIGAYTPDRVVTNKDLEQLVDTSDEWIRQRTGIERRRRAADDQAASDLALKAAQTALERADTGAEELDAIIVGTITGDHPMPATACILQAKLGAGPCMAFDVSAACAGFVYALSVGEKLVRTGAARRVLVVGVEVLSSITDWTDRNTCILFGDGAGATVLGPAPDDGYDSGILSVEAGADGSIAGILSIPAGGSLTPTSPATIEANQHVIQMDGRAVFRHAVRRLTEYGIKAMEVAGVTADDIDLVCAHQANLRILKSVAERCGIPMDRFWNNIHEYGNTSSASVPLVMNEAYEAGRIKRGDTLLLLAAGAGLSYGGAVVRW